MKKDKITFRSKLLHYSHKNKQKKTRMLKNNYNYLFLFHIIIIYNSYYFIITKILIEITVTQISYLNMCKIHLTFK